MIDPIKIIEKYYEQDSKAYYFLIHHGKVVAKKALEIARKVKHLNPDMDFIYEASMLHDIGIIFTNAPKIGCFGYHDYISHGTLGRELLEKEGLYRHALVCERHVGIGFTAKEIKEKGLPLPERDMMPQTLEEKIICLADKFFSKREHELTREKGLEEVKKIIRQYGEDKLKTFEEWLKFFNYNSGGNE